jgi:hypothetical protein
MGRASSKLLTSERVKPVKVRILIYLMYRRIREAVELDCSRIRSPTRVDQECRVVDFHTVISSQVSMASRRHPHTARVCYIVTSWDGFCHMFAGVDTRGYSPYGTVGDEVQMMTRVRSRFPEFLAQDCGEGCSNQDFWPHQQVGLLEQNVDIGLDIKHLLQYSKVDHNLIFVYHIL